MERESKVDRQTDTTGNNTTQTDRKTEEKEFCNERERDRVYRGSAHLRAIYLGMELTKYRILYTYVGEVMYACMWIDSV